MNPNRLNVTITTVLLFASPASAGGVPVLDQAAIARTQEVVSAARAQVAQLNRIVADVGRYADALGMSGAIPLGEVSAVLRDVRELTRLDPARLLDRLPPELRETLGSTGTGTSPFASVPAARTFAREVFYAPQARVGSERKIRITEVRRAAARDAAVEAYATATWGRGRVARAGEDLATLKGAAETSTTLRGDMAVNTEVLLHIAGQLDVMLALLAAEVEMRSAAAIAADRSPSLAAAGTEPRE